MGTEKKPLTTNDIDKYRARSWIPSTLGVWPCGSRTHEACVRGIYCERGSQQGVVGLSKGDEALILQVDAKRLTERGVGENSIPRTLL
jgi:hypothetical protein